RSWPTGRPPAPGLRPSRPWPALCGSSPAGTLPRGLSGPGAHSRGAGRGRPCRGTARPLLAALGDVVDGTVQHALSEDQIKGPAALGADHDDVVGVLGDVEERARFLRGLGQDGELAALNPGDLVPLGNGLDVGRGDGGSGLDGLYFVHGWLLDACGGGGSPTDESSV